MKGIADSLEIPIKEAIERTKPGQDLHSLRVDLYAYLSAWLVCSLDNDNDVLMPLEPIGMSYKEKGSPEKDIYKRIISNIGEIILSEDYRKFTHYPISDPLQSTEVRKIIAEKLIQISQLIDKYEFKRTIRQ